METIQEFISTFMSAISNCSLYSKEHTSVDNLARKALSILEELTKESESIEIMIIDHDLLLNKIPVREIGMQGNNFMKRLKRKGISRVDFLKGVIFSELKQFIADISAVDKDIRTYPHIRTGTVDVRLGGLKLDADINLDSLSRFSSEQVEKLKDIYHNASPFKRLNVAGLEEIVVNFIITFKREANILKLISPVKSYSEYTYTHATNVAVLSMFQSETLGVKDDMLRDIGIAALLHDVGKLFISKEILEKKAALDDNEWQEIRLHPLYGARYLAKIEGIPRLASIVAFEHHLRYDGKGYPASTTTSKKQHLCSQIVAISDFFDALRSRRPYRRELEIREIIALMMKDSGSMFSSVLLDNFMRAMHNALSE